MQKFILFNQQWLEQLNEYSRTFQWNNARLDVNIMGWIAQDESDKKSKRVKAAIRKENGITKSYKGNKWGRKSLKVDGEILELRKEGKTIREIQRIVFYWDKNNHKKFVSVGYIHKILKGKENVHLSPTKNKEDKSISKEIAKN